MNLLSAAAIRKLIKKSKTSFKKNKNRIYKYSKKHKSNSLQYVLSLLLTFTFVSAFVINPGSIFSATANHVVISEVQVGGGEADDEFIELYNPTSSAIDISSWSIQRETTTGSFARKNFETGDSIPAHGYFLVAHTDYDGAVTEDMVHSAFTLSSTGTTVFLVNNQLTLVSGDEASVVDKVAIGTSALDAEGSNFPSVPSANSSVERLPGEFIPAGGNGEDSDNNAADFALRTTSEPQNTLSSTETPAPIVVTPPVTPVTPPNTPTPTSSPSPTLTPTNSPHSSAISVLYTF